MDIRLWIWPKKKSVEHAIHALREASIAEHNAGAVSGDDQRVKANEYEAAQKDMAHELEFRQRPNMRDVVDNSTSRVTDKSIKDNNGPIGSGGDARASATITGDRVATVLLAILLSISVMINVMDYTRGSRNEEVTRQVIEKANEVVKDHGTQDYLTRYNLDWFRSHEFAELEVKVGVLQQTCGRK